MNGSVKESDWKLFRKKLPEWQEAYMGKLNQEYLAFIKKVSFDEKIIFEIITGSSSTFSILGIHFIKGQLHSYCPYSIIKIHGWHEASCCADMILVVAFERIYACRGSRQRDTAQQSVCMGSMYRI